MYYEFIAIYCAPPACPLQYINKGCFDFDKQHFTYLEKFSFNIYQVLCFIRKSDKSKTVQNFLKIGRRQYMYGSLMCRRNYGKKSYFDDLLPVIRFIWIKIIKQLSIYFCIIFSKRMCVCVCASNKNNIAQTEKQYKPY